MLALRPSAQRMVAKAGRHDLRARHHPSRYLGSDRNEGGMNSTEAVVARLDERLSGISKQLDSIVAEQKAAAEGRRRGYEAQERTEREVIGINHRLTAVEKQIETI